MLHPCSQYKLLSALDKQIHGFASLTLLLYREQNSLTKSGLYQLEPSMTLQFKLGTPQYSVYTWSAGSPGRHAWFSVVRTPLLPAWSPRAGPAPQPRRRPCQDSPPALPEHMAGIEAPASMTGYLWSPNARQESS